MSEIYVASSWRNEQHPEAVRFLRERGWEVYDFRNPSEGGGLHWSGFHWSQIDPQWQNWSVECFRVALEHPVASSGFDHDMRALVDSSAVLLLLPCGKSAHLEAGFARGSGKPVVALIPEGSGFEPELMYRMFWSVVSTLEEADAKLRSAIDYAERYKHGEEMDAVYGDDA